MVLKRYKLIRRRLFQLYYFLLLLLSPFWLSGSVWLYVQVLHSSQHLHRCASMTRPSSSGASPKIWKMLKLVMKAVWETMSRGWQRGQTGWERRTHWEGISGAASGSKLASAADGYLRVPVHPGIAVKGRKWGRCRLTGRRMDRRLLLPCLCRTWCLHCEDKWLNSQMMTELKDGIILSFSAGKSFIFHYWFYTKWFQRGFLTGRECWYTSIPVYQHWDF